MKHLFVAFALAFGLTLVAPVADVAADTDASSDSWSDASTDRGTRGVPELDPTIAGSAMVLLLGGIAYVASRRRKDD